MAEKKKETKRRGRAPAKLNCEKPGVGMAYVGKTKDDKGKSLNVRIGTTCARDTNPDKGGELVGAQLTNYSGVPGKGLGEKYFTGKLARKGNFIYLLFFCTEHHKKTMGAEVKAEDLLKEQIENTIGRILKKVEAEKGTNAEGMVIIDGFLEDVLDYEWTGKSWKEAKAEGMKLFEFRGDGFEEIDNEPKKKAAPKKSTAKKTEAKAKKPASKSKSKKTSSKKSASKDAKDSGAAKKPRKKENRKTFYGIKDGKAVTKRAAKKPEGYYDNKADRDEALKAITEAAPAEAAAESAAAE